MISKTIGKMGFSLHFQTNSFKKHHPMVGTSAAVEIGFQLLTPKTASNGRRLCERFATESSKESWGLTLSFQNSLSDLLVLFIKYWKVMAATGCFHYLSLKNLSESVPILGHAPYTVSVPAARRASCPFIPILCGPWWTMVDFKWVCLKMLG